MPVYDDIAANYDASRGGEQRGEEFAALIDARLPAGSGPVLDIGMGTGVVALGLSRLGREVVGVDLSVGMLRRSRERIGPRVAAADARALPFATASVAHAVSVWLVHHVEQPERLFEEVRRLLHPGGYYLVFPNFANAPVDPIGPLILAMHERARALNPAWHRASMDASAILALGRAAGFEGGTETVTTSPRETTAAAEIDTVRRRAYPALVGVDDAGFEAIAGPTLAALAALGDGPIIRPAITELVILRRP